MVLVIFKKSLIERLHGRYISNAFKAGNRLVWGKIEIAFCCFAKNCDNLGRR